MPAGSATYLYTTRAWKYPDARPEAHQKPRLGFAQADALWDELAERRKQERIANERRRAPRMIAELEAHRCPGARQGHGADRAAATTVAGVDWLLKLPSIVSLR